jgi:hypothetical protein
MSKQRIFRDKALQQYIQGKNKTILPRFASPPVFIFLWMLLGLLIIASVAAWLGQIPTFVAGSGIILNAESNAQQDGNAADAVIFVPAISSLKLQIGLPVQVQIGSTGPQLLSTIATVEPGVISPGDARKHYDLTGGLTSVITQPSFVVTIRLGPTIPVQLYAGSTVYAQVQVGTRRVLSLLPGFDSLNGG